MFSITSVGSIQWGYGPLCLMSRPPRCGGTGDATKVKSKMVKRRKVLIGAGSLLAGGAAATGTGAFTSSSSARAMEVNVAEDSSGFVRLKALNDTYASGTDDGSLEIGFDDDSGVGLSEAPVFDSEGLNPNSTFNFDQVFQIINTTGLGDMRVVIEASGFDLENLEITASGEEGNVSEGTSLLARDYNSVGALPKLFNPGSVRADMTIETKDDTTMGDVGGTLTIHAATGGNRDELADDI